jgi:hypothetical protein
MFIHRNTMSNHPFSFGFSNKLSRVPSRDAMSHLNAPTR